MSNNGLPTANWADNISRSTIRRKINFNTGQHLAAAGFEENETAPFASTVKISDNFKSKTTTEQSSSDNNPYKFRSREEWVKSSTTIEKISSSRNSSDLEKSDKNESAKSTSQSSKSKRVKLSEKYSAEIEQLESKLISKYGSLENARKKGFTKGFLIKRANQGDRSFKEYMQEEGKELNDRGFAYEITEEGKIKVLSDELRFSTTSNLSQVGGPRHAPNVYDRANMGSAKSGMVFETTPLPDRPDRWDVGNVPGVRVSNEQGEGIKDGDGNNPYDDTIYAVHFHVNSHSTEAKSAGCLIYHADDIHEVREHVSDDDKFNVTILGGPDELQK